MEPTNDKKPDITEVLAIGPSHRMNKRMKQYIIIVAAIVAVIIVTAIWKTRSGGETVLYRTEEVKKGDITVIVTATGTLQPTNKVEVGSELSGTVKSVEADYNSKVKVGQVLARLDTAKLEATTAQSRAALESAKAKIAQAEATVKETKAKLAQYQKVRETSNNRVPSQTEMDAAEAAYVRAKADADAAKATASQAKATLDTNETDLAKSVIKSPINGIVLTRSVEPGQTVAAAMTTPVLFTLAEDLTRMDLHVNVDEADISKVREGQTAAFTVAAHPNRTFEALIVQARYGSSTTSGVVTYETVLKVNNSDLLLRPGMTATADITVQNIKDALLIPSAALRFTPPVSQQEKKPSGGLIGSLLPHPPAPGPQQDGGSPTKGKVQRVWVLKGKELAAVSVKTGSASGSMTEVTDGALKPRHGCGGGHDYEGEMTANALDEKTLRGSPLVEFQGVRKVYGTGYATMEALRGIDLRIDEGEFVAIMGPSGSGKSTCMNILGCLDTPTSGAYLFKGIEVNNLSRNQRALLRRHYQGFVFQGYNLLNRTTALENVELPLIYRGMPIHERHQRAHKALDIVGLTGWESHNPGELSGGQQQRVSIARAVVTEPDLLLADEPTGNLDSARSVEIMELLTVLNQKQGITIIMITHEEDMAAYAKRVVHFKDGLVVSDKQNGGGH